ncbi:MAG: TraB/GumN family protein [Pseudomonadota bacterium]
MPLLFHVRTLILSLIVLLPSAAAALCNGPDLWSQLSDERRADIKAAAGEIRYGSGNFWEATRDGTTLTIIGTMHLPDPRHQATLARLAPLIDAADLLLVEATLQDQSDMQVYMSRNPDLMTITDGPTLPDLVDEDTWAAIEEAAAARGVPGFMAAKMQPWFLSLTLALPPCAMSSMIAGDAGIDNMIIEEAQSRGLPVAALEPWEDMFALLTSGTFEEQLEALRLSLVDPDLQDAIIVSLIDFYFAEQSAVSWQLGYAISEFLPDMDQATFDAQMAQMEQQLLIDRNASWIPEIEAAAAQHEEIMIAFGAAHLFDETGVLALLEANGWTISPL